jgi:murein DD-endopeptidase MepM/ murein hydrolase activator NlpD
MVRLLLHAFPLAAAVSAAAFTWPTPNPEPAAGAPFEEWVQPTVSGEPTSALFGCVRNDGDRFHEAVDIAPYLKRDRRGEATDPVYAAWAGRVVHVNALSGLSSYGRYVVLEHPQFSPAFYTLYAHLASIDGAIEPGVEVSEGATLGIMGRSASYRIPKDRAHLHFEIGLRLTDQFQPWYDRQKFGSNNDHGVYNGMNLAGLDSFEAMNWLLRDRSRGIEDYFQTIKPAAIIEVATPMVPDFVRRYPGLVRGGPVEAGSVAGWRLTVTGFGLPLSLEPLRTLPSDRADKGEAVIVAIDPAELDKFACRDLVIRRGDDATLGSGGRQLLELLFNFR